LTVLSSLLSDNYPPRDLIHLISQRLLNVPSSLSNDHLRLNGLGNQLNDLQSLTDRSLLRNQFLQTNPNNPPLLSSLQCDLLKP
jgi:hypothetical protein